MSVAAGGGSMGKSAKAKQKDERGAAGRRGEDVRSDLYVEIEQRAAGGIDVALTSRVEPYYGRAIREQAEGLIGALGLAHALVEIDDQGALPFVIAARIEAAARRMGASEGDARPERTAPERPRTEKDRLRRSRLYLPGNEPKYMINAGLYRPDGIILDLEDSVHPREKDAARLLVRNALRCVDFLGAERMVRINQLPLGLEDLEAVLPEKPDLILVPKVESPDQVRDVDAAIDRLAPDEPPWLMPILESALGIERAFAIATASPRVAALTIGLEDLAADLGIAKSADGAESDWARRRVVNAARAAGAQAIDSVYGDVDDTDGLEAWAESSRRLGFEGMGCLHPSQLEAVHGAFAPSAEQVWRARRIVAAYEDAQARGLGVVSLGSKMIDAPVVKQALRVVRLAEELGIGGATDEAGGEDGG
ncbi:MAG: aldolase/citrate lyase family protein [Acidobacteriota bacterium]|nr:aldolase/citrate lyase family protein [Acidobacteriota bacterium]